ncbi:MAG: hypothetical protein M1812_001172 [Candelaria pacifica]|nr:MAG: hypothetical protein M1812_001172 [Candelaria pacifica]
MGDAPRLSNPPKLTQPSATGAQIDFREPSFQHYLSLGLAVGSTLLILPGLVLVILKCWRASRWPRQCRPTSGGRVPFHRRLYIRGWLSNPFLALHPQSLSDDSEVATRSSPLFIDPHPPLPVSRSGIVGPPPSPVAGWQMLEDRPSDPFGQWPAHGGRYNTLFNTDSMACGRQSSRDSGDDEPAACGAYAPTMAYHTRWWGGNPKVDNEKYRRDLSYRRLPMSYPEQWMILESNAEQEVINEDLVGARLPTSSATFYAHLDQDLEWNRRQLKPGGQRLHPVTRTWLGPVIL